MHDWKMQETTLYGTPHIAYVYLVLHEASVDSCHTSCVRQRRDGVGMLVSLRTSCNEPIEEDRFVGRVQ